MRDGLRLALTTLTVARVRSPAALDRATARAAMVLAPVVGLGLGLLSALLLVGATAVTEPVLGAALAVAALAALTRGLHLDGLADLADGLASYAPPERARQVMKSPEVGALGVVTVVLVLLLQVTALTACAAAGRGVLALVLAAVTARVAVTAACTPATPAAAPVGMGSLVAGTVPRAVPAGLAVAVAVLAGLAAGSLQPAVAVALGLLAARALRRHAVRRVGGVSGDVLGALVEVTTTVVLLVMAVQPPEW